MADSDMGAFRLSNQINAGNIITLALAATGFAYGYGQLNNRITNLEVVRSENARQVDQKLSEISTSLTALPNLTYRVTANEKAIESTNARFDASLSDISARLSEITRALGSIDTSVAVLTQRLENNDGRRATIPRAP